MRERCLKILYDVLCNATCLIFVGKWAVSVRCLYGVLPVFTKPYVFQKDRTVSLWLPVLPKELLKQLLACPFAYESPPAIYHPSPESMGQNSSICNCWLIVPLWITAPIYDQQSPTVNRIPSKPSKIFLIEKISLKKNMDPKMTTQKWCFEKTTCLYTFPFSLVGFAFPQPLSNLPRKKNCGEKLMFLPGRYHPLFGGRNPSLGSTFLGPNGFQICFMFTPKCGEMIQFDQHILFKWVGSTTN